VFNRKMIFAVAMTVATTLSAQQSASKPTLTADHWRADLKALMQGLEKTHKNMYHATSPASFDSAAADLDERIPSLERHEIIAGMMRIVAMVGDGHTNIYPSRDAMIGFHTLPVALYLFKDGMFIRAADSSHAALIGSRVVRIGDVSIDEAYARVKPYIGRDNEMGAKFWAAYLLAMPEMLHAMRLSSSPDSARFELEKNGKHSTIWLRPAGLVPMTPADTDMSWWRRAGWVDARDISATPDPLWLSKRPDSVLWWFTRIPDTRSGYAQINQVRNGDKESFEDFSDRLLHFTDTAGLDRLIIDLRLNRGGNGGLLKPLERGLLRRPNINRRGSVFILTGRSTWSAAQFFLNDLSEFSEAIFVGEPSGSKGNSYGDSRQIKLPNSGITARASIYYWQDWDPNDSRPWIAPDVAAELTFADYEADRDRALTAALGYNEGPTLSEAMKSSMKADDTVEARALFETYRADSAHVYVDTHRILDNVAVYFYNRKDISHATWAFALAAEVFPHDVAAHLNLAAMYREAGKADLERASLKRALELDPDNAFAAARLRTLKG
jgi:tetratricopeptide (TPR) repeat protein